MDNNKPDISVVLTAHREGILAQHTINSLTLAIEFANRYDISTEVIIVLDNANRETELFFKKDLNLKILNLKQVYLIRD